ncbi:MAG: lysylphosphatidylglycerol synthase domain-containing protein [Bacteroidota bacterium]
MLTRNFGQGWRVFFTPGRRRFLRRLTGGVLLLVLVWQLAAGQHLSEWWSHLKASWAQGAGWKYLLPAVLLMPVNWTLEALKWRQLMAPNQVLTWRATWASVLAGISISLATPNRVGEYGGRAMVAPAEQAVHIIWTSVLGSLCQWTAFLVCGWPSLCFWFRSWYGWSWGLTVVLALLMPALVVLAWVLLFRLRLRRHLSKLLRRNKWWRWLQGRMRHLSAVPVRVALSALVLALLRFGVYCYQLLLILWFFNAPLSFGEGISGIFSIYLIQAGIPLPPGLSVISRSEIAVLFWQGLGVSSLSIVSATFSVYLINLILPALAGTWILLREKNNPR